MPRGEPSHSLFILFPRPKHHRPSRPKPLALVPAPLVASRDLAQPPARAMPCSNLRARPSSCCRSCVPARARPPLDTPAAWCCSRPARAPRACSLLLLPCRCGSAGCAAALRSLSLPHAPCSPSVASAHCCSSSRRCARLPCSLQYPRAPPASFCRPYRAPRPLSSRSLLLAPAPPWPRPPLPLQVTAAAARVLPGSS